MLHKVAAGEVRPPRHAGPLAGFVMWLLRRDPVERPSMRGVHDALTAAVAGHPLPEYQPAPQTLVLPNRRVSRRTVVAGVAAAGLVAAGVAVGLLLGGEPSTGAAGTRPPATSATSTTSTTPPDQGCVANYKITNAWPDGYQAEVTVRNDGTEPVTGWTVGWTMPAGHTITGLWNGVRDQNGAEVTVENAEWNVTVRPGESTSFGMTVNAPDAQNAKPPQVACTAG
jgi:hypothetical protein